MDKKTYNNLYYSNTDHAVTTAQKFKHNLNAIMKEKKINRIELAKK